VQVRLPFDYSSLHASAVSDLISALRRDRYGRPRYNWEVPDAAELTARLAVVVGLVRPVALETLPATGTWGTVANALGCDASKAQADWESLSGASSCACGSQH
jgi:hypothetical protein